jgi:protein CrcB
VNPGNTEQVVDGKDLLPVDPDLTTDSLLAGPVASARVPHQAESATALPIDPDATPETAFPGRPRPRPQWRVLGAIAFGGFAGGLARYEIGLAVPARDGTFPVATFAINVSGAFVLALLLVYVMEIWPPTTYVRPLLGTGFCGAFTTFSTWMVGTDQLIAEGKAAAAVGYLLGSLLAGLAATSLGLTAGRAVLAHRRRAVQARADLAAEAGSA